MVGWVVRWLVGWVGCFLVLFCFVCLISLVCWFYFVTNKTQKRKQKTLLPQVGYQVHKARLVAYVRMIIKFINVDSFLNMSVAERNAEKETLMYKIPQAIAQKLQAFQLSIPNQLCSRIYLCG